MANVIFENVNDPCQPRIGVYVWYFKKDGREVCIYVGNAGERKTLFQKSTLARGITEACRSTFSSDSVGTIRYAKLDADFVIGTCLQHLIADNINCYWKHIDDDPKKETEYCSRLKPLIQDTKARIFNRLKFEKKGKNNYWKIDEKFNEAGSEVRNEFKKLLNENNI